MARRTNHEVVQIQDGVCHVVVLVLFFVFLGGFFNM